MHKKGSLQNLAASAAQVRLSRLLLAAALVHIFVVVVLNVIGRYGLAPYTFDEHGIGVSFAVDSTAYRDYIIALVHTFEHDGLLVWLKDYTPFHVKLYSLCYLVLGRWLGYTTLSAEPLNLAYYLLILVLTFALGREFFDRRVGILAASVVAIWPSLLLHTTQLLRDPIFIAALLSFLLTGALVLKRECSWKRALALCLAGGVAANLIWLIRSQMWEVLIAIASLNTCLILLKQMSQRRIMVCNMAAGLLLLLIVLSLPQLGRQLNLYSYPPNHAVVQQQSDGKVQVVFERQLPPGSSLPARISFLRAGFVTSYPGAGSNIDDDVRFHSITDIILYLPRAAAIGFFAPFPNMWLVNGPQVGWQGRLLSGFETLLMYGIEVLTIICLWSYRKNLPAWLLFASAAVGILALGLVVANVATLYRMRYAFWILLIILGTKGALRLLKLNER